MKKRAAGCVLCIGRDLLNLNLRCTLLKEHGWETLSFGNAHDGVFRFAHGDIGLVVLDLNQDGSEAALIASELKRQSPNVPIVMLVRNQETLAPGATAQADAVVLKSEEELVLPDRVRQLLGSA